MRARNPDARAATIAEMLRWAESVNQTELTDRQKRLRTAALTYKGEPRRVLELKWNGRERAIKTVKAIDAIPCFGRLEFGARGADPSVSLQTIRRCLRVGRVERLPSGGIIIIKP